MLTIYIVDDEPMAINYLACLLGACGFEHEIVGTATNSAVALEEILRLKPDVVFTDISMPVMDGLKLARRVLSRLATRLYLLTSYEDFAFAREGVKLGAADYILKNELTEEMLKALLVKAEEEISRERRSRRLVLESTARDFLLGAGAWPQPERAGARYALLAFFEPGCLCVNCRDDRPKPPLDTAGLLSLEWPEGLECLAFTRIRQGTHCAVIQVAAHVPDGARAVAGIAASILARFAQANPGWKCVQTPVCSRFEDLPAACAHALAASERLYACPGQDIFSLEEVALPDARCQEEVESLLERIHQTLGAGSLEEALSLTKSLLRLCREKLSQRDYEENLRRLCQLIRRGAERELLNAEELTLAGCFPTCVDLEQAILDVEARYFECLEHSGGEEHSEHVRRALEYIRKNLNRDISVTEIADALGISEGHLRRLFKQELSTSVIDTLTELRMERAKRLLREGGVRPSEVWARCGFSSAQYFNQVFRKKEGVSPRDYARRHGEEGGQ